MVCGWQAASRQRVCCTEVAVRLQVQKLFRRVATAWPQTKVFWRLHMFGVGSATRAFLFFSSVGLGG